MGLLDQTCGGMVVYPTFSRRGSSQDESSKESPTKEASGTPANPRQHFFERAGQEMVQDESESQGPPCSRDSLLQCRRGLLQGFPCNNSVQGSLGAHALPVRGI